MMLNVNDMYQICTYAVNKGQNGYLTPANFNLLVNQAQISFLDFLLGESQQYQYGRPQARVNYSQNENIRQRLTPLIKKTNLTIDGTTGLADYPEDYQQVDALWYGVNFSRIRYTSQDNLYSYFNSQIDPIATNPIYLIKDEGLQFYPVTIGTAVLSYISNPPQIIWGYTLDVNDRPVYNPAPYDPITQPDGSIQPVWYDVDKLEIISRVLKLVGLNLKDGMVEQYANQITTQGQ